MYIGVKVLLCVICYVVLYFYNMIFWINDVVNLRFFWFLYVVMCLLFNFNGVFINVSLFKLLGRILVYV